MKNQKNIDYIFSNSCLSKEKYKKYFQIKEKKNTLEDINQIQNKFVVGDETILEKQIELINKESLSNIIDPILKQIPKKNTLAKTDIIQQLAKRSIYGVRGLQARYKELQELKFKKVFEIEVTKESIQEYAKDDKFDIGEIKEIIKFNYGYILDTFNGIFFYDKIGNFHEILLKPVKIIFKTIDVNLGNIERYTFDFGGINYRNKTFRQCLKELESKTVKFS